MSSTAGSITTAARNMEFRLFADAAEAWFWYYGALKAKSDGWTMEKYRSSHVSRPCELTDIVKPVIHMARRGELSKSHLTVLHIYGMQMREPIPEHGSEVAHAALWSEAMAGLANYYRGKGILEEGA